MSGWRGSRCADRRISASLSRKARRAAGLTQLQLAEQSGLERTYLAKLEAGPSTLVLERSLRVLRRLGANVVVEIPAHDRDDAERRP